MDIQVNPNHYFNKNYDTKERFVNYWHQINEITSLEPSKILEIGVGNKFLQNYLKGKGYNVISLDIDKRLRPDFVGSVLSLPFRESSFELIACYELLEHIPYEHFSKAVKEVYRVTRKHAIFSIPDTNRCYKFQITIPKIGEIKKLIKLPRINKLSHQFDGQHYWEIGKYGYPLKRIKHDITSIGFDIRKTYRIFESPYHRFFVLSKLSNT